MLCAVLVPRVQPTMLTLEEAFHSGVLMRKHVGIICACAPNKKKKSSWGPKPNEWKVHAITPQHQVRTQPGLRKLPTSSQQ